MKYFIKNLILLIGLPFIVLTIGFWMLSLNLGQLAGQWKLNPQTNSVFMGDSHLEGAIIDSTLPGCQNVALNSESYFYTLQKLKVIIKNNPSVKKVYLGLGYHNLSSYFEPYIFGEFSAQIGGRYYYLLPANEQWQLWKWNKNKLAAFLKNLLLSAKSVTTNNAPFPYIGGYNNLLVLSNPVDSSIQKRIQMQYYEDNEIKPFSDFNIKYLDSIVDLSREHGLSIVFINTPLATTYKQKVPEFYLKKHAELLKKYKLPYIDLSELQLASGGLIPDGDHVSCKGANELSLYLKEYLNSEK